MKKYEMLLGEPVRCYRKTANGYEFRQIAYYVGSGFCVSDFASVCDKQPYELLQYDRYIPVRLWNDDYNPCEFSNLGQILLPEYSVENFNTENLKDYYKGHLDDCPWWHEIQERVKLELKKF